MEDYEKLEKKINETKMYAKRTMDLWADSKKWEYLANEVDNEDEKNKYMNVSNTLMELFKQEVENMRV